MEKFIKDCGLYLVIGGLSLGFGGYGLECFIHCDYILFPNDSSKWSTDAGYTVEDWIWLVVGVYCIPISIAMFLILTLQTFKGQYDSYIKLLYFYTLLAFSIWFCALGNKMAHQTLECGIFCVGDLVSPSTEIEYTPGQIFVGLVYFFISLLFIFHLITLIILTHIQMNSMNTVDRKSLIQTHSPAGSANAIAYRERSLTRKSMALSFIFLVFYPLIILACVTLPTWWSGLTYNTIRNYEHQEPVNVVGYFWTYQANDNLIFKLFPDILLFYSVIYVVAIIAILSQLIPPFRSVFHMRIDSNMLGLNKILPYLSITTGEIFCCLIIAGMLLGQFCFFYFNHGWQNTAKRYYTTEERAARSLGQVANVCMGLLVLPISRNNIWAMVFGVSWESMIRFHQYLGGIFGLVIACHAFCWWKVYSHKHTWPHDVFAVPQIYHADNFTVPLAVFSSMILFAIFYPAAHHVIRRLNYDVFYIIHHFFMILFFVMLWHATMGWYFVAGGFLLCVLDHVFRLRTCVDTNVKVVKLSCEPSTNITQLSYLVSNPLTDIWSRIFSFGEASTAPYHPLEHDMGQYCFINIPAISTLEWHPFTISSAPGYDNCTSHHIKALKPSEWTGKLNALARKYDSNDPNTIASMDIRISNDQTGTGFQFEHTEEGSSRTMSKGGAAEKHDNEDIQKYSNLVVNIDGPYGLPIPLSRYTHVLFIAGGIGITPMHSYFRYLYESIASGSVEYSHIKKIRLIWCVRSLRDAKYFEKTFISAQQNNLHNIFSYVVYLTKGSNMSSGGEASMKSPLLDSNVDYDYEQKDVNVSGKSHMPLKSALTNVEGGRPDLQKELQDLRTWGKNAVVFTCGPASLSSAVGGLASKFDIAFETETFEF